MSRRPLTTIRCPFATSSSLSQQKLSPIAAAIAAGLFSLSPDFAWAANINVGADQCTLANAISNANSDTDGDGASGCVAGGGADVIVLPASSTQTLRAALPDITSEITIEGNGATLKRRAGAERFRILAITETGNLTLKNTTITGGFPPFGDSRTGAGGGISNLGGVLVLNGCTVSGNTASSGGGVLNILGGTTTVVRSTVSGNYSSFFGGGVYNGGNIDSGPNGLKNPKLSVIDSTISGNVGRRLGGGVFSGNDYNRGDATLDRVRIVDNQSGRGGGIFGRGNLTLSRSVVLANRGTGLSIQGTATISDSTISGNQDTGVANDNGTTALSNSTISGNRSAGFYAGGIDGGFGGSVSLTNCTVSGNSTEGRGGGVANPGASVTLTNTTVSGNHAAFGGGVYHSYGTTTLVRSLISGNSALLGLELFNYGTGSIVADSHNLFGRYDSAGVFGFTLGSTDIVPSVSVGAILNPLARNGGRTRTLALVTGSPAIDAGGADCLPTDQRRVARPVGAACDIGAYEGDAPQADLPTISIADASVVEGTSDGRRGTRLNFTVSLSGVQLQDVYGAFAIADGTATARADYSVPIDNIYLIPAGAKRARITVNVNADAVAEAAETLTVSLSPPIGGTIADGEAIGTIIDDD